MVIIVYSLFFSIQFSLADYTSEEKAARLTSEQGQQRIETYCDECPQYSADQGLDDYLNSAEITDLMNQDWSKDGRWLWGWWSECKWVKLNTNFPIIWNCIWDDAGEDTTNVFPTMVWALTKLVVALILVVCFILVIYAGILWAMDKPKEAKDRLKRVAITVLLLWFSWAILRLINPNFFS